MALDTTKVFVGRADQSATAGAICSGDVMTTIPANLTDAVKAVTAFETSGYVSSDGVSLSTDYSTKDITEWNGGTCRKVLETFTGEITFTLIQTDYASLCQAFGEENVEKVAATKDHGEQLHVKLGTHLPKARAWAFRIKDGDAAVVVLVPNGAVTSVDDITFSATEAISLPVTVTAYDDGTGESIHIYTDDGVTSATA